MVKTPQTTEAGEILAQEMAMLKLTPEKTADLISINQGNGVSGEEISRILGGEINFCRDAQKIIKITKAFRNSEKAQVDLAFRVLKEAGFIVLH